MKAHCSRRTVLSALRINTEFGIIFLRIGTRYYRRYCGTWKRSETGAGEFVNTTASFNQGVANPEPVILEELCLTKVTGLSEEVCSKTAVPHITMHWIKEVEMAKSMDDLVASRTITGLAEFTDYDMLDVMIASAFKKLLTHVHHRKRASVEEQRAQHYYRFSRGWQIACMIYEHFRATGAHEAVQGPSDLFNIRLQNDDVQDFDTRWDQAPLAASETSTEMVLEDLYKSKLQDSVELQTVLALHEQENIRNNEQPSYSRLKTSV